MKTLRVRQLTWWWEKAVGLLGTLQPSNIYFKTRFGIHTFGMLYPIDVLILDDNFRVVKTIEHLPPNRFLFWSPMYSKVLELPSGDIKKHSLIIGTDINIVTL